MFPNVTRRVFISMALVAILPLLSWYILSLIEAGTQRDIAASLRSVNQTSHQAIRSWVVEEKSTAEILANTESIAQLVWQLLEIDSDKASLVSAPVQEDMRQRMTPILESKQYQGYFVIAPNGQSLASSRDVNIGSENLLTAQPRFLHAIWSGKSAISLPLTSDVPLPDQQGVHKEGVATMFSGAPVYGRDNKIVAALVLRINPARHFTHILQRGGIGSTGETYAFDHNARMISNSRFDYQLRQMGLISAKQDSLLNIRLRNPGHSLVEKNGVSVELSPSMPLTLMAEKALQGQSGQNMEGYLDYRGVAVFGAWVWDDELNLGLATEIDVQEAYATYRLTQYTVYVFAMIADILLIAISIYFVMSRKRISESERQFKLIVNESPFPVVVADADGNVKDVNRKAVDVFGWTPAELHTTEQWLTAAYSDEQSRKRVHDAWDSAVQDAVVNNAEMVPQHLRMMCKNGDVREVEVRMTPLSRERLVIAIQDLTDRIRNEEERTLLQKRLLLAQKREAIARMTGGIAHEFNNNLTTIAGYTQLAMNGTQSEDKAKVENYLSEVLKGVERAAGLVNHMLAYTQRQQLGLKSVSPEAVVKDLVKKLQLAAPARTSIRFTSEASLPALKLDVLLIEQLIRNLCANAATAMDGQGCIDISLRPVTLDAVECQSCHELVKGEFVQLAVTDTGDGIPDDMLSSIFEPFFTTLEVGKGSGLGLTLVHGIVHDHGGHIRVESELGKGTSVLCYFPVVSEASSINMDLEYLQYDHNS